MRKHNEGYALVLVLVVFVVLALLATAILSASVRNLQDQVESVGYIRDKYQAQGEIEKVLAQLKGSESNPAEIQLKIPATVDASVKPADKTVQLTAKAGTVQIECTLKLECESIIQNLEGTWDIAGFSGMEYTSYKTSTVGGDG